MTFKSRTGTKVWHLNRGRVEGPLELYYYVVESARVDGKPRIVHQAYLGTADKVGSGQGPHFPCPVVRHFARLWTAWRAVARRPANRTLGGLGEALRLPDPALRRPATCCWPPTTASVNPGRKLRWPTGTAEPFCTLSEGFRRNASPRKPFWDAFERFCPTA